MTLHRLLAPWREVDRGALFNTFPQMTDTNEVDCPPESADARTPEGHWVAGYFDDEVGPIPAADEWVAAVAAAPPPAPPEPDPTPDPSVVSFVQSLTDTQREALRLALGAV